MDVSSPNITMIKHTKNEVLWTESEHLPTNKCETQKTTRPQFTPSTPCTSQVTTSTLKTRAHSKSKHKTTKHIQFPFTELKLLETKHNQDNQTTPSRPSPHHQWAIPLSLDCIPNIPGASVTPLGVAEQWSINENNNRIKKRCTTHDCSFPGPSGHSCNTQVIPELLKDCHYGHDLRQFLHGIHNIRALHPNKIIWLNKTDMDAAY
jgi:hypothetical protein